MLFLCSVALCSKTTIAIFDFQNNGLEPHEVRQLSKRLESELVKLRNFDVVERARIDEILKEQKLQTSGCTETCLLDVGKILGATQIVYGSIGKIGDLYTISAKLVDAETGKLIRSSDYDADYGLTQLLKHGLMIVANRLTGNQIEDNYIHPGPLSVKNKYEINSLKNVQKKEEESQGLNWEAIDALLDHRKKQEQQNAKPRRSMTSQFAISNADNLYLHDIKICRGIYKRNPVMPGTDFMNNVDTLFCYVKIENTNLKQEVIHEWYYETQHLRSVKYNVPKWSSSKWSSWSRMKILSSQIGKWKVNIITENRDLLGSIDFNIIPKKVESDAKYDIPPSPKTAIQPKYPRKALNDEIEGTVIVQAFVDMYGYVRETIVLESIRKDLDKAAAKSLKKTRFSPAKKDGNPVGVWISVPVNFKLK